MSNHVDPEIIEGASPEAATILRTVLASLIAGITTEVKQTSDYQQISVDIVPTTTGLKFTFTLPNATALAASMVADFEMSDVSVNPVQNKAIKAYVDGQFWTGTAAEYAELEDKTGKICFLSDTNIIMYNEASYSLSGHVHGGLSYTGAIGTVAGLVIMTGANGVLEAVTVEALKELLGASSGLNLLHNAELADAFNTLGLTIYNTTGECIDRWNLIGAGSLTINTSYATLAQTAINTAKLRQYLPFGSYERLLGQTLVLSVLLDGSATVYEESGEIDGVDTTIINLALTNNYTAKLVVDNGAKTAYVEIAGGATAVASLNLVRVKLEVGSTSSIEDGITDGSLDVGRILAYDVTGARRAIVSDFVRYGSQTLTTEQKAQARTNIGAPAVADVTPAAIGAAVKSVAFDATLTAAGWGADCLNLFDEAWSQGSLNDSTGAEEVSANYIRATNYTAVSANTAYSYADSIGSGARIFWYTASAFISYSNVSQNGNVTSPATATRCRIRLYNASGILPTAANWAILNSGATIQEWEPKGKGIHLKVASYAALAELTAISAYEILPAINKSFSRAAFDALQAANLTDGYQVASSKIVLHARGTIPTMDIPIRVILRGDIYA